MANGSKSYRIRSVGTNLTANAANVVYTCPPNHTAKVELLFVTNTGGGLRTVTIKWHDVSANKEFFIVGGYNLPSHDFLKIDGSYLALNAGDYIVVTPEAGSVIDVTVSVEEYFDPTNKA